MDTTVARPRKFNPKKAVEEVKYLASLGLNDKQIATKLNLHVDEFRYHRKNCPELEQAMQSGLNETIVNATVQLGRLINSGDFKAIKFFLEKKGGWDNQVQIEPTQKPSHSSFNLNLIPPKNAD